MTPAVARVLPDPWRPITDAKKDGSTIQAAFRRDLVAFTGRKDLKHWAGKVVPLAHAGIPADGFDVGWHIPFPVGCGGFPDEWITGWMPSLEAPVEIVVEISPPDPDPADIDGHLVIAMARIDQDRLLTEIASTSDIERLRDIARRYRRSHIEQLARIEALTANSPADRRGLDNLVKQAISYGHAVDHTFDRAWKLMAEDGWRGRSKDIMIWLGHELAKPSQWLDMEFGRQLPEAIQSGSALSHVRGFLDLSTAHLRPETRRFLEEGGKDGDGAPLAVVDLHGERGEYGWWIWAGADEEMRDRLPADLRAAIVLARKHGCDWICFDRDAEMVNGLATYPDEIESKQRLGGPA